MKISLSLTLLLKTSTKTAFASWYMHQHVVYHMLYRLKPKVLREKPLRACLEKVSLASSFLFSKKVGLNIKCNDYNTNFVQIDC